MDAGSAVSMQSIHMQGSQTGLGSIHMQGSQSGVGGKPSGALSRQESGASVQSPLETNRGGTAGSKAGFTAELLHFEIPNPGELDKGSSCVDSCCPL